MAIPIIILAGVATVIAGNAAYDYLFPDNDLPNVNNTTALSSAPPYVPPFQGGQCTGDSYKMVLTGNYEDGTQWWLVGKFYITDSNPTDEVTRSQTGQNAYPAPITSFELVFDGVQYNRYEGWLVYINGRFNQLSFSVDRQGAPNAKIVKNTVRVDRFVRMSGAADNCGNPPDPNGGTPPPIPNGGVPQNNTTVITGGDQLVEGGLPVVFVPPILSALAGLAAQLGAAIANAQAAADTLAAIKATADAVDKLAKMLDVHKETLDKLRKYLNKKEKEDDAKKTYLIRQYGTILRDGYLDLTPRPAPEGFRPLMLDFLCANVPNGLGRFFGINSYNWFRYQELGSICFLSPTAGVLSVHKIEHVRTSIAIPELAIGFTYNMGLNGIIRARVSMLYTQEKT